MASSRPWGRMPALLLAGVLVAVPARLPAEVNGSPHDLVAQEYDVPKDLDFEGKCGPCHLPIGLEGGNFLRRVPPSLKLFDEASLLCFSCHDGTTLVNGNVDASSTAFHPLSHGFDLEEYRDRLPGEDVLPGLEGERMSCVTCHDPHDNGTRPFLRMAHGELCRACHENLVNVGTAKAKESDDHPLLVDYLKEQKESVPIEMAPTFRVPFPSPYPPRKGRKAPAVHWKLGGHLEEGATGRTDCVTCHAVHGDEAAAPRENLLSVDPVGVEADEFCEGCHRGERGDGKAGSHAPNPGGTVTARTYHPCDDDEGNGAGDLLTTVRPKDWPVGTGRGSPLLCTTCHRAHNARKEDFLLRPSVTGASFCEECHDQLPTQFHHPVTPRREVNCLVETPLPVYAEQRQGLYCSDCHKAHNAGLGSDDESGFIPILRAEADGEDFCQTCHPEDNPTCSPLEQYRASHFMGDPTLDATYQDSEPPERVEPWPESALSSLYGGESGKSILCLSCHSFRQGALTSGDGGTTPFLLARAGNKVEWEEGNEAIYLCTGCHSSNPGTGEKRHGGSHPLMSADILKLKKLPELPVTSTPGGHINCDSCHRPHGAVSTGGYYILEVIEGPNTDPVAIQPQIDFTIVCRQCHDATEY